MRLSIIIPTLNEEALLPACLASLQGEFSGEIVVCDGGSRDGTREVALAHGVHWCEAPRGLARQCNAAAAQASGDVLFFVSADSRPAPGWYREIERVLALPTVVAGGFRLTFLSARPAMAWIAWGGNFRSRYLNIALPDQGLFVRKEAFAEAGGMPEASLIPYIPLCERLGGLGEFRLLEHPMGTSARKWERHGLVSVTWNHLRTYLRFRRRG